MISKTVGASILAIVMATPAVDPAAARTVYDGLWNLSIVTESGECGVNYQFQVQILDGIISYLGPANVSGRVSSGGDVQVSASSDTAQASGSGKISRTSGRGRWTGRSGGARCSGSWTVQRN